MDTTWRHWDGHSADTEERGTMNAATVVHLRPKSGARPKPAEQDRARLTDAMIKRLKPPQTSNKVHYDGGEGAVRGFGIRITAGDSRAFVLNYRTKGGRERRYTIGGFPNW